MYLVTLLLVMMECVTSSHLQQIYHFGSFNGKQKVTFNEGIFTKHVTLRGLRSPITFLKTSHDFYDESPVKHLSLSLT